MQMRGVVLSAGKGSRLRPLSWVASKPLLPIYDKPMVYYPISTLMLAGIRNILLICSRQDLVRFQNLFKDGSHLGICISYAVQETPKGVADALLVGADFIGSDPVSLILGDNIFFGEPLARFLRPKTQLTQGASVVGYQVAKPERFGVADLDENGQLRAIIEKPAKPPSSLAICGLYFYDHQVVDIAKSIGYSARNELEITDVNNQYLQQSQLQFHPLDQGIEWFDAGTFPEMHRVSTRIRQEQEKHQHKIGCLEEVAYRCGYIDEEQLERLMHSYEGGEYANYLASLLS